MRTFRCSQRPYSRTEFKARNRSTQRRRRIEHRLELAEAAERRKNGCGQCLGTGTIEGGPAGDRDDEECPVCDGTGELRDHDG